MGFIVVSKVNGQCKFGYALTCGMLHESPYCGVTKVSPFTTTQELSQYDSPVRMWVTVFLHYAEVTHVRGSIWYNDGGGLVHRVEA